MLSSSVGIVAQEEANPNPVTSVSFLTPDTNPNRIDWSTLIAQQLPKAGITVNNEIVEWDTFGGRTFGYDVAGDTIDQRLENGIPLAKDGGYDMNFIGLSGTIDYDPTGSYSKNTINPSCCNFAFYSNPQVENLIKQYTSELNVTKRVPLAKQIQAIIYDEMPYIPIVNTEGLWAYDSQLTAEGQAFDQNDLLMLATLNYGNYWSQISHPSVTDFVYGHTYDLTEYVPFVQQSYAAAAYMNPIFPGLFERDVNDPNFAYKPALAASMPTPTDNGTTFLVDINPNAKFSNGDPVTAQDVVNTYHMHMAPAARSALAGDITSYISKNDSISVVDSDTVKFVFDDPYFGAYGVMSIGVMDENVIGTPSSPAAFNYTFNESPLTYGIGAGPYQYDTIEKEESNILLTAVDNWWGGDVGFDSVSFKKYSSTAIVDEAKAGNIQIIDNNANFEKAEFEGVSGWKTESVVDFGTQFLAVNMKHPIFGTGVNTPLGKEDPSKAADAAKYMRQAIAHLIPRQTIIDEILKGRGSVGTSLWPAAAAGYDTSLQPYEYNATLALELVKKAGYTISYPSGGFLPGFGVVPAALAAFMSALVVMEYRKKRFN